MKVLITVLYVLLLPGFVISQYATNTSKLTGTIYDPAGAVVAGAKVAAIAAGGKKFLAVANEDGVYVLDLSTNGSYSGGRFKASKYDLIVESSGFQRSEIKGYLFIPIHSGKMILDIGLDIGPYDDGHTLSADPQKTIGKPE